MREGGKKSARTKARQADSKARTKTVKRAAQLKQLSKPGGKHRAKAKLSRMGTTGTEWK